MKKYTREELEAMDMFWFRKNAGTIFGGEVFEAWNRDDRTSKIAAACLSEIERRGLQYAFCRKLNAGLPQEFRTPEFYTLKAARNHRAVITAAILAVQEQEEQP